MPPLRRARGPASNPADESHWSTVLPADVKALSAMRGPLAAWARSMGLADETVDDVVLASYEALANAAEHAYRGRVEEVPPGGADSNGTRQITLSAERTDDAVVVTVADHGRWLDHSERGGSRGRGLVLMRELADDMHIDIGNDRSGTTVCLHWCTPAATRRGDEAPWGDAQGC